MNGKGFIRMPRRLFNTKWWDQKRMFSDMDAITDIYQMADINTRQCSISYRMLADRWLWNQMRVKRFLEALVRDGYIHVTFTAARTILEIVDFGNAKQGSVTPSVTPVVTQNPLSTKDSNDASVTHVVTPSVTVSRAYKNDIFKSSLSKENKEEKEILSNESTKKGDESPTRATDDLELRYKKWMDENFPLVQKMQKPLTFKQYQKIIEDGYTVDEITSELEDMENWSKLKTKTTANLTLRNWLKKDYGKRNYTTQHAG